MKQFLQRCALMALALSAPFAAQAQTSDLLISEYVEGSSFNKAIEIYNGTAGDISFVDGCRYFAACMPIAIGGLVSAIAQGKVAAASVNLLAKNPDHWAKGMILCITVEFYAILSLLASMMMLLSI